MKGEDVGVREKIVFIELWGKGLYICCGFESERERETGEPVDFEIRSCFLRIVSCTTNGTIILLQKHTKDETMVFSTLVKLHKPLSWGARGTNSQSWGHPSLYHWGLADVDHPQKPQTSHHCLILSRNLITRGAFNMIRFDNTTGSSMITLRVART